MKPSYHCIMLIEDSAADSFVAEILIRNTGLAKRTMACTSAAAALSFLAEWDGDTANPAAGLPELILLGLYLPVMDGFYFLEQLERLSLPVKPTVYIVTASIQPADRERASSYGCVKGFLIKPLTAEGLGKLMK